MDAAGYILATWGAVSVPPAFVSMVEFAGISCCSQDSLQTYQLGVCILTLFPAPLMFLGIIKFHEGLSWIQFQWSAA